MCVLSNVLIQSLKKGKYFVLLAIRELRGVSDDGSLIKEGYIVSRVSRTWWNTLFTAKSKYIRLSGYKDIY
jgi:hypothetical protein